MTDISAGSISKKTIIPANAVIAMMRPVSTSNSTLVWDLIDSTILANAASIVAETAARNAATTTILGNINTEISFRAAADNVITSSLTVATNGRTAADAFITNTITNEISARSAIVSGLSNTITLEIANRTNAVTQETILRTSSDINLTSALNAEIGNRVNAITNVTVSLSTISNAVNVAQVRADTAYSLASNAATGNSGGSVVSTGTETIYTANGTIANTDSRVFINSPTYINLTLPNGTVNRRQIYIKRIGTGNSVISASLDTVSTNFVMNSPNGSDALLLEWNSFLTTWLIRNYYDPGLKVSDLATATLSQSQNLIVFETDGTPKNTTVGAFNGLISPNLALSATRPTAPSSAAVGTPITGMTTTLTPNTATAYAVLYDGSSEVRSRVSFTGNAIPSLTPISASSNTTSIRIYAGPFGGTPLATSTTFSVAMAAASGAVLSGFPTIANSNTSLNLTGATITLSPTGSTGYAALSNGTAEIGSRTAFTGTTPPAKAVTAAGSYTYQVFSAASGGSALATSPTITVSDIVATGAVLSGFPTTGTANVALSLGSATITITPSGVNAYAALSDGTSEIGSRTLFTGTTPPSKTPPTAGNYTYQVFAAASGGSPIATSPTITVAAVLVANSAVLSGFPTTGTTNTTLSLGSATITVAPTGANAYAVLSNGTAEIGSRTLFTGTTPPAETPPAAGSYTYQVFAAASGGSPIATSPTITVTDAVASGAVLSGFPTTGTANVALSLGSATITVTPTGANAYATLSNGTAEIGSRTLFTGSTPPSKTPPTGGSYTYQVFAAASGGSALATSPTITVANAIVAATGAVLAGFPTTGTAGSNLNLTGATVTLTPTGSRAYATVNNGTAEYGARTAFTTSTPPAKSVNAQGTWTYQIFDASTGGNLLATSPNITVSPNLYNLGMSAATYSSANAKFGSALISGNGSVNFTTGAANVDQTISFFMLASAFPTPFDATLVQTGFGLQFNVSASNGVPFITSSDTSSNPVNRGSGPSSVCDGVWHHLRVTYSASLGTFAFFVDGVNVLNSLMGSNFPAGYSFSINSAKANLDEILVENIYYGTSNFTPPTSAATRNANTVALYHLDGNGLGS